MFQLETANGDSDKKVEHTTLRQPEKDPTKLTWQVSTASEGITVQKTESFLKTDLKNLEH